jgi:hypothetical protein
MRVYFEGWIWAKVGSGLEGVTVQNIEMDKTAIVRFFCMVVCLHLSTVREILNERV